MRISDWSSDVCSSDLVPEATAVEARRFYDRHRERFASEPLVEAEHILFSANPADEFAYSLAVGDARMAIRAVEADPACFAELARAKSARSEEHTSELQSLMRISYAVFCLKKKTPTNNATVIHVSSNKQKSDHL